MENKINYCHFSLDKFYRHTRGFTSEQLAEYLNLYVEYMETGQCSSIPFALQPYWDSRGIKDDFQFLYEKAINAIDRAKYAAKERWDRKKENAEAMLEQCTSIKQANANININYNINENIKENKNKYGAFAHVLLKPSEHEKLVEKFGVKGTEDWINILDEGIELKGYKYKSHYLAILKWANNSNKQVKSHQRTQPTLDEIKEYIRQTGGEDNE